MFIIQYSDDSIILPRTKDEEYHKKEQTAMRNLNTQYMMKCVEKEQMTREMRWPTIPRMRTVLRPNLKRKEIRINSDVATRKYICLLGYVEVYFSYY